MTKINKLAFTSEDQDEAIEAIRRGLKATIRKRAGRGQYVEIPNYPLQIKCAALILDRNMGKAASTLNINDSRDEGDNVKSPKELLDSMQANLPLIQSILQNMSDAAKTIDVTPLPRQLGNISQSDQPTDSVSGGSEAKPQ